ncbi:MAG TPA: lipid-A-disaccharide synthase [Opitutales bacterium]|nr:lipid-A-disaccharide synthase [Opitutales bacterium]
MSAAATVPPFAAPATGSCDILFIAGEHSGDQQAARLIEAVRVQRPELAICAIGGERMREAGAQQLFDLTKFSVVGIVEVLKHLSVFRALLANTQDWIAANRPKVVCLVDYPGFNLRLAASLYKAGISRKAGGQTALCYYIGPQIWAWKKGRRFEMEKLLDSLAVIFPFETACYADTQLDVRFTGHPFAAAGYESKLSYDAEAPVILLPGSREQPVSRIFPAMLAGFGEYLRARPGEKALVLYPDAKIEAVLRRILAKHPEFSGSVELRPASEKSAAKACLISSGTMSLSCALAGIPGAICYRAHPLTYRLGKLLVKIPHLGIANILMPENPPYPEYLQGAAQPGVLARELADAAGNPARARASREAADRLRAILSSDPAHDPVQWLLSAPGL